MIKFFCAFALFLGIQQLVEIKTHGFCLQRIFAPDLFTLSEWDTPFADQEEKEEILQALDQPYTFLSAGSECFVFASQDGRTVIKFFKLDTLRPVYLLRGLFAEDHTDAAGNVSPLYAHYCSLLPKLLHPPLKRILGMREFRIGRTFNSLKNAFCHLKEETGLLYLHLNPTNTLHKTLTLYDPSGIAHKVELDSTRFYLQTRAQPLEKQLLSLKKRGEHERAKKCADALFTLILSRCHKGFADRDAYNKNFGIIQERAVEIDTGSFISCPSMQDPYLYKRELILATLDLRQWAQEHYPELLEYLLIRLDQEIQPL